MELATLDILNLKGLLLKTLTAWVHFNLCVCLELINFINFLVGIENTIFDCDFRSETMICVNVSIASYINPNQFSYLDQSELVITAMYISIKLFQVNLDDRFLIFDSLRSPFTRVHFWIHYLNQYFQNQSTVE